ncbi:NACHT domain-containing protein [Sphaerisporangium sp. NPDC051011]|uniref:NACHT domain-containing protein n=1 Tax=Sphaerisporangium sp. NPDC051011 TaxID=3155792 RepID=UPI0033D01D81
MRKWAWIAGVALLVVAGVFAWRGLPGATWGDVDPSGVVLGLAGLALAVIGTIAAVVAIRPTLRSQWMADTDVDAWAQRLAVIVYQAETTQLTQLLAGQGRRIDVRFVLTPAPGHPADGAAPEGTLKAVTAYFRDLRPQRLVITGAGGSGKTVLALELILTLLEPRIHGSAGGGPVPIRIPAAGWNPGKVPVKRWLVGHLVGTFRLSEVTARALVDAHRILPVIDGLDEMDESPARGVKSEAGKALRALNKYQDGSTKARLVLTCRTAQYETLTGGGAWAHDAARVELAPVTPAQARSFIESVSGTHQMPRWRRVLDALDDPVHPLAAALSTPWRLTLATTVYQPDPETGEHPRDPAYLASLSTDEQISEHLLSLFIPSLTAAATAAEANPHGYRPEQIHRWLHVLARYLHANRRRKALYGKTLSTTDLVLHELWPLALDHPGFATRMLTRPRIKPWPEPARLKPAQFLTREVFTHLPSTLTPALVSTLLVGSEFGPLLGLMAGFVAGPVSALTVGLRAPGLRSGVDPREPVRDDRRAAITVAVANGSALGSALGLISGLVLGLAPGIAFGLVGGLLLAVSCGLVVAARGTPNLGGAALRYTLFRLSTRGALPRRLPDFLHWCYADAGLMRVAGIAYQFRHRELQDHLATHPAPAQD